MNRKRCTFIGSAVVALLIPLLFQGCETTGEAGLRSSAQSTGTANPIGRKWDLITNDGLHDIEVSSANVLQPPEIGLTDLPAGEGGNQVNWVEALADGYIYPRSSLNPDKKEEVLDLDVLLKETGEMPMITFPHIKHTLWLGCENCHDHLFARKAGATKHLNMYAVLAGEKCGVCHGKVAFPPNDCIRCHNTPRASETVRHKKLR